MLWSLGIKAKKNLLEIFTQLAKIFRLCVMYKFVDLSLDFYKGKKKKL